MATKGAMLVLILGVITGVMGYGIYKLFIIIMKMLTVD